MSRFYWAAFCVLNRKRSPKPGLWQHIKRKLSWKIKENRPWDGLNHRPFELSQISTQTMKYKIIRNYFQENLIQSRPDLNPESYFKILKCDSLAELLHILRLKIWSKSGSKQWLSKVWIAFTSNKNMTMNGFEPHISNQNFSCRLNRIFFEKIIKKPDDQWEWNTSSKIWAIFHQKHKQNLKICSKTWNLIGK